MVNNVVSVSGVQQSDSVIHIHVSILFQILLPSRLLHNIEQSSLCYTVGPCWLSILNIAVWTCQFPTPNLSSPPPSPLVSISLFSESVTVCVFEQGHVNRRQVECGICLDSQGEEEGQ